MPEIRIRLEPLGSTVTVAPGTPLRDVLFPYGVEFPCGGRGRCKRCRVRVLEGTLPVTAEQEAKLTPAELAAGWRLACHASANGNLTLDIAQWDAAILADDSAFDFTPSEGLGIAVDLGTTTLVAQLLDLATGHVLGVRTALNPQAAFGADIMSRVEYSVRDGGQRTLEELIRAGIGSLVRDLVATASARPVRRIVIVGNTVMHHLFCGIPVEPLSHVPFEPSDDGLRTLRASELGWSVEGDPETHFLPCLGGFVGSDILAGILASRVHEGDSLAGLIDLGTNGEITFGTRERLVCASTAAGPAFEGGRISCGMRAATGAIDEVDVEGESIRCHVLGHTAPRGICGSGLVDAVAAGLDLGIVTASGKFANGRRAWELAAPVNLTQRDVRELQLAKAAIGAGIRVILSRLGACPSDVSKIYLAGAFGNYVNRTSARRLGLLAFPEETVQPAGNTALLGAKLALFNARDLSFSGLRGRVEHIGLASDPEFQDIYVEEMAFSETVFSE